MKTASLLLAFPLLLPVCTTFAAPRELRTDGRYEFRANGKPTKYIIAKDEVYRRASGNRVFLSARDNIRSVQDAARQLGTEAGERVDMVAYPEGQIPSDANRRVVARSISLRLEKGLDPMVVASAVNATSFRRMVFAPDEYVLQFPDNRTALSAAQDLKGIEGVSEVTVELARNYRATALPTFTDKQLSFATSDAKGQQVGIFYDFYNQKTMEPAVFLGTNSWAMISKDNVKPYQWYLKNTGEQIDGTMFYPPYLDALIDGKPLPLPPPSIYTPDAVPPFAIPNDFCTYNPFLDILADINVMGAWANTTGLGEPINGTGVRVAVMDDGIQTNHEDLTGATLFDKNSSYNFLNGTYAPDNQANLDPSPTPATATMASPNHGTNMAGLIFGRANNGKGGVGVAYGAKMIGYRFRGAALEDSVVADMLTWGSTRLTPSNPDEPPTGTEWRRGQPKFDVAVNGWNDSTSGANLIDANPFFKKALAYGVQEGRGGKGVIYVFPAGNEGESHGNSNYAYTSNSIYSIHVGSISDMGRRVIYSSPGASVHVVAPSGGREMMPAIQRGDVVFPAYPLVVPATDGLRSLGYTVSPDDYDSFKAANTYARTRNSQFLITTDAARKPTTGFVTDYNKDFSGTSASTALVGGVVALMLQANPNLGWRDVQEILMRSARVVDGIYGEWAFNSLGMPVSHKYGAGLVDADHAVAMAKVWKNLGPPAGSQGTGLYAREWLGETRVIAGTQTLPKVDKDKKGVVMSVDPPSGSLRVEQVVVKIKIAHTRSGDLGIILTSPQTGQADAPVESYLFIPHREDVLDDIGDSTKTNGGQDEPYEFYEFTSIRHWGTTSTNPVLKTDTGGGEAGGWQLRVWDNTDYGKTTGTAVDVNSTKLINEVYVDRVTVPEVDNVNAGIVKYASISFRGTNTPSENLSPVIVPSSIVARPGKTLYYRIPTITDTSSLEGQSLPRAPMLRYHFKVLGPVPGTTEKLFTSPNSLQGFFTVYPPPEEGEPELVDFPSFRFGTKDGILTNVVTPNVTPDFTWQSAKGVDKELTITVGDTTGLGAGMYVVGKGIAPRARIAPDGVNAETGVITLTAANNGTVNSFLRFTNQGPSTGLKGEYTIRVESTAGLVPGMYVYGTNTGFGAQIAGNGINAATRTVTLTVPNIEDVNEVIFFTDLEDFAFPGLKGRATGKKNERTIVMEDTSAAFPGFYVTGGGIGNGAKVVKVDEETKTVTLTEPNKDTVILENELSFNSMREFNSLSKGRWNVEVSATNIFGTTRKQMILEVKDEVTYDQWVNTFNPPITDPKGDPDADGLNNFLEFASGGDPYVADSYGMPSSSVVDGKAVFRYQVDKNALGVQIIPQVSSDLSTWAPVTPVLAEEVGNLKYFTVTMDMADPHKFFRLKTQP